MLSLDLDPGRRLDLEAGDEGGEPGEGGHVDDCAEDEGGRVDAEGAVCSVKADVAQRKTHQKRNHHKLESETVIRLILRISRDANQNNTEE